MSYYQNLLNLLESLWRQWRNEKSDNKVQFDRNGKHIEKSAYRRLDSISIENLHFVWISVVDYCICVRAQLNPRDHKFMSDWWLAWIRIWRHPKGPSNISTQEGKIWATTITIPAITKIKSHIYSQNHTLSRSVFVFDFFFLLEKRNKFSELVFFFLWFIRQNADVKNGLLLCHERHKIGFLFPIL